MCEMCKDFNMEEKKEVETDFYITDFNWLYRLYTSKLFNLLALA